LDRLVLGSTRRIFDKKTISLSLLIGFHWGMCLRLFAPIIYKGSKEEKGGAPALRYPISTLIYRGSYGNSVQTKIA
jgi:hypothetical protein